MLWERKGEVSLSPYRLREKLKVKYPKLIFHRPMARNRSNLLYADIVTSGDVVETIPDDISRMDESSQNKETSAHETSFEGLQFQTATAKNSITLLVNVDTNIS